MVLGDPLVAHGSITDKKCICYLLPDFQIGVETGLKGGVEAVEDDAAAAVLAYTLMAEP